MTKSALSAAVVVAILGVGGVILAAGGDSTWPQRQADAQHTGRADYVVPVDRIPDERFFDVLLWQKPSPDSPDSGHLDAAQMIFYDGAGPDGADIVLGTYHWPKGIQGMHRHTGQTFWSGLPDGGEAIAQRTPAFSPGGDVVYVGNDATSPEHPLMAFRTTDGPGTYWHNGGAADPSHLGGVSPVVGSDGRIFLHPWIGRPYAGEDTGIEIVETWGAASDLSMGLSDVALYEDPDGSLIVVATARDGGGVKAYDGRTGAELWARATPDTDAAATIDPDSGNVYFGAGFGSVFVVGLDKHGEPLWDEPFKLLYAHVPGANPVRRVGSMGCLSWDGATYYFQAVSEGGDGELYAIDTADGAVKWTYPTGASGGEGHLPSPIVTRDGVIVVGNNASTYWALRDDGTSAGFVDRLDVSGPGQANGTASLASDGILYLPVRMPWLAGNGDGDPVGGGVANLFTAFDLRSGAESPLWPPRAARAFARNGAVLVKWQPIAHSRFDHYAIYRAEAPFSNVEGLVPLAVEGDGSVGSYLDATAENGTSYYYAVTAVASDGTEYAGVTSVGPRTPHDETDLQVVSIERTPLFLNYDVVVSWEAIVEPSGFGPYWYERPTGLNLQDEHTPRWPNVGDEVTYTATVRNRGTNPWSGRLDAVWTIDGAPVGDFQEVALEPGATASFSTWDQTWDGSLHTVRFEILPGDERPRNDALTIDSKSVTLLSFVDASLVEQFREETALRPGATTDDALDYLNRNAAWMSQMFAEAGSQKRVHFGRLEVLDDPDPVPDHDPWRHVCAPERWLAGGDPLRGGGYYDPVDDVDYQLIHGWGERIGLEPSHLLNLPPESNQVSFTGLTGPVGVMNNDPYPPFFASRSAMAMQRWIDVLPGYRGEYMYDIPAEVRVLVRGYDGMPLPDARVTAYQPREWGGKQLTRDAVKAQGVTGADGVYTLPNVRLDPALLPRTYVGAELHDNPFGYVDRLGRNAVLLLKLEKDGYQDFAWLTLEEVNLAYWSGATLSATFDKVTALGGPVQVCALPDMTEMNAGDWSGWSAGGGAIDFADDWARKEVGGTSLRMHSTGCFENWFRYPEGRLAAWDLTRSDVLRFRMYQLDDYGFQGSPNVRLIGPDGYVDLRYTGALGDLMAQAYGQWFEVEVPLSGNAAWERSEHGSVSLARINHLELFFDVWACDFTIWVDGVGFDPAPSVPPARLRLDGSTLSWEAIDGAASYDAGRGSLSDLGSGSYGACLANDVDALSVDDADEPLPGRGFFYLVRANVEGCSAAWGYDSEGRERVNTDPDACP